MSESDKAIRCVDKAVQELHEINVRLQNHNDSLRSYAKTKENEIEFHKQQAEFWAGECISEQREASYALLFSIFGFAVAFVAIGKAILSCQ